MKLTQHKFSKMLPPMTPDDFERLREDLRRSKELKVPILLYEGKVLDGWHRYQICTEEGIPLRTQEYKGGSPMFHCFSLNVARRHLLPPQLAALAVDLLPSIEKDAKVRRLATLKQNQSNPSDRGTKNDTTGDAVDGRKGKSRSLLSKQLGVSTGYIQKAKKIKEVAPKLFDDLRRGTKTFREVAQEIYRQRELERKDTSTVAIRANDKRCSLYCCDVLDAPIVDDSLNAIITDPPYAGEHLDCWKKLGTFAAQKLKEGGILLAMAGTYNLPEILNNLRGEGLRFYWTLAYQMPERGAMPMGRKVHSHWKPLLWFVKGTYARTFQDTDIFSGDPLASITEGQRFHKWGQSVPFFTRLVEKFTYADELVCDPFVGGGTTGLACLTLKRRFIGIDVDAKAIETTASRIQKLESGAILMTASEAQQEFAFAE